MNDQQNTSSQYIVLFTSQKLKKHKTWQDGTITYYNLNKKIVLTDEKGYDIDRKFSRTGAPDIGDEIEFDMHIVTVESYPAGVAVYHQQQQQQQQEAALVPLDTPAETAARSSLPPTSLTRALRENNPYNVENRTSALENNYRLARRRLQRNNKGNNAPNLSQPRLKPKPTSTPNTTIEVMPVEESPTGPDQGIIDRHVYSRAAVSHVPAASHQLVTTPVGQQLFSGQELGNQQLHDNEAPQNLNHPSSMQSQEMLKSVPTRIFNTKHQQGPILTAQLPKSSENTRVVRPVPSISPSIDTDTLTPTSSSRAVCPSTNALASPPSLSPARQTDNPSTNQKQRLPNMQVPDNSGNISDIIPTLGVGRDHSKRRTGDDTNLTAPTVPKRIRVGLSKRTGQVASPIATVTTSVANNASYNQNASIIDPLPTLSTRTAHGQGSANNDSTISSAAFIPASRVVIDEEDHQTPSGNLVPSSSSTPAQKRFKVPYADGVSVPLVLQFPTFERAMDVMKTKRLPKRTKVAPTQFQNATRYKDIFRRMIHEHLQIMLLNNALHFYYNLPSANSNSLERHFRSKGLSFYQNCQLKSNNRSMSGSCFYLSVKNRENSYKYGKDDIWVISNVLAFDASATFLARSTFFGPSSNGSVEIECITPRDTRVASNIAMGHSNVFALRTISASTEYMMLDCLEMPLERLPLLPSLLKPQKKKKQSPEPLHTPKSTAIHLTSYDNINVQAKLDETAHQYSLNKDQESVLRAVAKSVIVSPGWNEDAEEHITLVHGVFGSGKSFLAAVLIIFLRDIIDTANNHREPEDQIVFRIMISCFTNVAVDRILTILAKLGYDEFIRIGSLKKISKNLLPYTIKAKLSGNDELKELEHMLEDPQNSEEDTENIANALQRFRRCENILELHKADVVGTTCSASTFEIFSESQFPFILMDECSQVMEPLSLVPLLRFKCGKMVMIGDPKQLPPTVSTQADENNQGLGLEKSLFSRLIEMGTKAIMLRTQYRCHPNISGISNNLFYDRQLINGSNVETRPPLLNGLPPLLFVDVLGNEQRSMGNSFWNHDEIVTIAHILQGLSELGANPSDIGIISLYKEQADKIQTHLGNNSDKSLQNIQISTVDAFQGGEKEVIILSTVRTSSSGFIDNHPRVNVALTRAKRHLIILGSRNLLSSNEIWTSIISQCHGNTVNMHQITSLLTSLRPPDSA